MFGSAFDLARRIAAGNRWIIAAVAALAVLWGFEIVADRGLDLFKKMNRVGVESRQGIIPNFGPSAQRTTENDDFAPEKLKLPDVMKAARSVDKNYGATLAAAGIGYGKGLTSLIEAEKAHSLPQMLATLEVQQKLTDAQGAEIAKVARDMAAVESEIPSPNQKQLYRAVKDIFPDVGKYFFNEARD